jgi:hypothetical protein
MATHHVLAGGLRRVAMDPVQAGVGLEPVASKVVHHEERNATRV